MKATWDKSTGRVTFDDGRFVILTGAHADFFDKSWDGADEVSKEQILKRLVGSKVTIHYPKNT